MKRKLKRLLVEIKTQLLFGAVDTSKLVADIDNALKNKPLLILGNTYPLSLGGRNRLLSLRLKRRHKRPLGHRKKHRGVANYER